MKTYPLMYKSHLKVMLIGIIIIGLIGCQSRLAKTGQTHKLAVDKWQALANYATSELANHNVTITARLQLNQKGPKVEHNLIDIKLTEVENIDEINMLSPQFLMKYACHTQCALLAEYVPAPFKSEHSLLINYFSDYEFELFKFYADIMLLNEQINHLTELNPELVSTYLKTIVDSKVKFNSLSKFSDFLHSMLSTDKIAMFSENQKLPLNGTPWKDNFNSRRKILAAIPDALWQVSSTIESDLWKIKSQQPNETWLELTKDEELYITPFINAQLTASRTNDWDNARKNRYDVGDSICSYSENIFGIVAAMNTNNVSVTAIGQAKLINDGIVRNSNLGVLFVPEEDIYFAPLDEVRTFNKDDLAVCEIKIY